jgi:hypothetical protein
MLNHEEDDGDLVSKLWLTQILYSHMPVSKALRTVRLLGLWLIYVKIRNGKRALTYNGSIEEAFCVGWEESLR